MSLEIHQQPRVLERLLAEQDQCAAQIAAAIRERDVCYAVFAARGTSDNAARYAQYLFGSLNQLPVALATPSLFSIYGTPPRLSKALVSLSPGRRRTSWPWSSRGEEMAR